MFNIMKIKKLKHNIVVIFYFMKQLNIHGLKKKKRKCFFKHLPSF